jgi:hypothetical protein
MRIGKLMHRMRKIPLFQIIPIVPLAVVGDAVLSALSFRRLKRLEGRVGRSR